MEDIKTAVDNVMKMSIHNPVFGRESQRVLELIDSMLYEGNLDQHVASVYSDEIVAKRQGLPFADVKKVFDSYKSNYIGTGDKFVLFEHGVSEFLHARKICNEFMGFYSEAMNNHKYEPNNQYVLETLTNLSKKALEYTKANDENSWYYIYTLQELLINNIKKLKIYGDHIEVYKKILLACLDTNLNRIKPYFDRFESKGLVQKMDLFGTTKSFREFDTEMVKLEALNKFFVGVREVTNFADEFNNNLIKEYSEGKITKSQHRYINSNFNSYIYYLTNTENTKDYDPILTFMFGQGDTTLMHKYSNVEMNKAFKFAIDFYKALSEDIMATAILRYVLETNKNYESQGLSTREQSNKNLMDTLSMLLHYGVIDAAKYESYKTQIT